MKIKFYLQHTVGGENEDLPHLTQEYPSMEKQVTQLGFKFKNAEFSLSTYRQRLALCPDWSPPWTNQLVTHCHLTGSGNTPNTLSPACHDFLQHAMTSSCLFKFDSLFQFYPLVKANFLPYCVHNAAVYDHSAHPAFHSVHCRIEHRCLLPVWGLFLMFIHLPIIF